MGQYLSWLGTRGTILNGYSALWRWSVESPDEFWRSLLEFLPIRKRGDPHPVTTGLDIADVKWFPNLRINYAEQALSAEWPHHQVAILAFSQTRDEIHITFGRLRADVSRARTGLRKLGVGRGDRVAAYLPNIPEAIVAFLATASLGAIWSSCPPEFGVQAVVDRFGQITPKVLIAVDGYRYGPKLIDRRSDVDAIRAALGHDVATVLVPYAAGLGRPDGEVRGMTWSELLASSGPLAYEDVPFSHPLYILFSSGTTGLPKPIVHGHGGIVLQHLKDLRLHLDVNPSDRFFWYTTTGWMLWNVLVSGLLTGATVVCFDGDPNYPDPTTLWALADRAKVAFFGAGASFYLNCLRKGLRPGSVFDLTALRNIGSTGSPLPVEGYEWIYEAVKHDVLLGSMSGGTDVCAILVGPSPLVPVWAGEISCRALGTRVEAYDEEGHALVGSEGELVITAPIPSMPVGFWGDASGSRYRSTYFERFPGVWWHADWVTFTDRGSAIITGRSDATLKRGGVRLGTSEFYALIEAMPEVKDSLVVHLEDSSSDGGQLILFVVLEQGRSLSSDLEAKMRSSLSLNLSPRHVPDYIIQAPSVPRTLTQKKLEIPVKKILLGTPAERAASRGSMLNPESLIFYEELVGTGRPNLKR